MERLKKRVAKKYTSQGNHKGLPLHANIKPLKRRSCAGDVHR